MATSTDIDTPTSDRARLVAPGRAVVGVTAAIGCAALLAGCSGGQGHTRTATNSGRSDGSATGDRLVRHDEANDTYGSLPTYLPRNTVDNNAPITGRPGHLAVTSEGDEVLATVGAAHVTAEVTGPAVPGEGLPVQAEATTCTWRVTLRTSGGPLPVSAQDFNALDHLGKIYRVAAVPGQRPIPRSVRPGDPVSFELRAVMPTGEGVIRWAPDRRTILGEWDFTVEND